MPKPAFYEQLARFSGTALIEVDAAEQVITYAELETQVQAVADWLQELQDQQGRVLLALPFKPHIQAIATYLAALRTQTPLLFVDPALTKHLKHALFSQLGVSFEIETEPQKSETEKTEHKNNAIPRLHETQSHLVQQRVQASEHEPATQAKVKAQAQTQTQAQTQAAILMSTSGSSGSPKAVMLSRQNLIANTNSILGYLPIQPSDVAITSLPLHYSYGLSVLNTHLAVGASLVLTESSLMTKAFWQAMTDYQVSSLAGVPFHYQMLERLRIERKTLPSLRYLTQAGGKLKADKVHYFASLAAEKGWQFFVMYGQTEATARMAYIPPDQVLEHTDTIGQAIPGGRFEIRDLETKAAIQTADKAGELYYYGDNIMLGYAQQPEDWQKTHSTKNYLATGDLAKWVSELDANDTRTPFVKIVGRLSRFIKIQGKRYQLDHIESLLPGSVCCGTDEKLYVIYTLNLQKSRQTQVQPDRAVHEKNVLQQQLGMHPSQWQSLELETLPYLSSGKIDYSSLLKTCLQIN